MPAPRPPRPPRPPRDRSAISRVARAQQGVVSRWQLGMLGLPSTTIDRIAARDGWVRLHAGVYVLPGVPITPLVRLWAAVLALSEQCGPEIAGELLASGMELEEAVRRAAVTRVIVTGLSAAWLRGLVDGPPEEPHLLIWAAHHPDRRDIRITRATRIEEEMWSELGGLRVALGPRLLWDAAWARRHWPHPEFTIADLVRRADRLRLMDGDCILAMAEEPVSFGLPRRVPRGIRQGAELIRPGFSHSATEARAREAAAEVAESMGFAVERRPYAIRHDGLILAEADIAVVELRHDAEVDGPHHESYPQQQRDGKRDDGLVPVDWAVDRFPVAVVDESVAGFSRRYRAALQRRIDDLEGRRAAA